MNRLLPAALALLLAAAAPVPLAGRYVLSGVMEAAGGLELGADGRFRYGLSYGALDEQAEGKWRLEGGRVLLTTDPPPRPAEFRLLEARPGDPKLFRLRLELPDGKPARNIEVMVTLEDGSEEKSQVRDDWMEAELLPGHFPVSIRFHIPVFEVDSPAFPVDAKAVQQLRYVLDPRDLGVRDFRDWPLEVRGDLLVPEGAWGSGGFRRVETDD